jgi:DNA-binding transcriptional regulator YiaG
MSARPRPAPPPPLEIRLNRERAKLTQTAAAAVIYATLRTWQDWEAGKRRMHPALWELWRFKALGEIPPNLRQTRATH